SSLAPHLPPPPPPYTLSLHDALPIFSLPHLFKCRNIAAASPTKLPTRKPVIDNEKVAAKWGKNSGRTAFPSKIMEEGAGRNHSSTVKNRTPASHRHMKTKMAATGLPILLNTFFFICTSPSMYPWQLQRADKES